MTVPISVIMPAYVRDEVQAQYLRKCLDSCIDQTDDIVVVDDGSPYDMLWLEKEYPLVTVIYSQHHGKSHTRNQAVAAAKHELIYPVDADDWIRSDTLQVLYSYWSGTPLYSDLMFVHDNNVQRPYPLLPFNCALCVNKGIASVNVLHTKKQWAAIGGWDERLNLYEDWEYNARLFWTYCGRKIDKLLVYYRQHMDQSTKVASSGDKARAISRVRDLTNEYISGRTTMACCGNNRVGTRSSSTLPSQPAGVNLQAVRSLDLSVEADLTSFDQLQPNKVWARYFGGNGMGQHSRRGMASRKKYRVVYGGRYQVDKRDAISAEAFRNSARNCGFVEIAQQGAVHVAETVVAAFVDDNVSKVQEPAPVARVKRAPVARAVKKTSQVGDVSDLSIKELKKYIVDLDVESVSVLLRQERLRGAEMRIGAINILQKAVNRFASE